ncbi:MAG: GatB/YqeY domain-containing protein [bacterium]|nr:GatB/YqeY domain-containing protein [bacterium]
MIHNDIKDGIKIAMKSRDTLRLSVLRGILTAYTNELVATGHTPQDKLDDESALVVIKRLAKQRKESISQFTDGGRLELADEEKKELEILEQFLPKQLSREEILPIAKTVLLERNISDKSGMGQAIGEIMKKLGGTADGGDVRAVVEDILSHTIPN